MGWIMGDDGVHRCPPLPFILFPREGRTATCEECGQRYVIQSGGWRKDGRRPAQKEKQ